MKTGGRSFGDLGPILVAAVSSSVLTFLSLIVTGWVGMPTGPDIPMQISVFLSIVFLWGPAFAFIPAAVLGFALERPLSRRLIARANGGFLEHLLIVLAAALMLWLLLRVIVVLAGPQTNIVDLPSLAVFVIVGLCSALSWWFLVVIPGRRR